jgi:hypothetical protein
MLATSNAIDAGDDLVAVVESFDILNNLRTVDVLPLPNTIIIDMGAIEHTINPNPKIALTGMDSIVSDNVLIYPNPASSMANISLDIVSKKFVKLEIFDYLCRKIETLNNCILEAGYHNFQWNTCNIKDGVYLAVFVMGDNNIYKSVVIKH